MRFALSEQPEQHLHGSGTGPGQMIKGWPDNLCRSPASINMERQATSSGDCHQSGINFNFNFSFCVSLFLSAIEMSQLLIKAPAAAWEDLFDISVRRFALFFSLILICYFFESGPDFESAN